MSLHKGRSRLKLSLLLVMYALVIVKTMHSLTLEQRISLWSTAFLVGLGLELSLDLAQSATGSRVLLTTY